MRASPKGAEKHGMVGGSAWHDMDLVHGMM